MPSIDIVDNKGEKKDSIKINEKIFDGSVNKPLLKQAITMYLANQRLGAANSRMRKDVRGGGKKPWRQKGTGRARAGSIRSPLWRGGGVTFGPAAKNFHYQLPRSMKKVALRSALNAKINDNCLTVIEDLRLESHKTKELNNLIKKLKLVGKNILVVAEHNENLIKASRNIKKVQLIQTDDVNAYAVCASDGMIIEKKALDKVERLLKKVA